MTRGPVEPPRNAWWLLPTRLAEYIRQLRPTGRGQVRKAALAGCGVVLLAGAGLVFSLSSGATLRYDDVPRVELVMPGPDAALGAVTSDMQAAGAPAAADPDLLEPGPFGPLPKVGPDGRTPWRAYARSFAAADAQPRIALLIAGLGLRQDVTAAALALPGEVSLQFSPYAGELAQALEDARRSGHETFLELPVRSRAFPVHDPGPYALDEDLGAEANLERLHTLLARAAGYAGLAGSGGRLAASPQAQPVLRELAVRGLALVEIGGASFADAATAVGLPYLGGAQPLAADPSETGIAAALAELERRARETGTALGVAEPYPRVIEHLASWAKTLPGKGLALVPVSALVSPTTDRAAAPGSPRARNAGLVAPR